MEIAKINSPGKAFTYAANHEQPLKNYLRFKPDNKGYPPGLYWKRNFLFI